MNSKVNKNNRLKDQVILVYKNKIWTKEFHFWIENYENDSLLQYDMSHRNIHMLC